MHPEVIEWVTQFGVAGLMGMLWGWERAYSRRRERQLTESHVRLTQRAGQVGLLVKLLRHNTKAIVRFEKTQQRMCEVLEKLNHDKP